MDTCPPALCGQGAIQGQYPWTHRPHLAACPFRENETPNLSYTGFMRRLPAIVADVPEYTPRLDSVRRLWLRVLTVSLSDCLGCGPALQHGIQREAVQLDALEWLASERGDVGTVVWICGAFDLSVEVLRKAVDRELKRPKTSRGTLIRRLGQTGIG